VPCPFSKVYVKIEDGVDIPKDIDQDEFEQYRVELEQLMNQKSDEE